MKYLVVEIQVHANGAVAAPSWAFDSLEQALAKYYTVLAAAALSSLPVHSCVIVTDEGFQLRKECFKHEVEPEPEPVSEEPA